MTVSECMSLSVSVSVCLSVCVCVGGGGGGGGLHVHVVACKRQPHCFYGMRHETAISRVEKISLSIRSVLKYTVCFKYVH